jgi:hypothetical protein
MGGARQQVARAARLQPLVAEMQEITRYHEWRLAGDHPQGWVRNSQASAAQGFNKPGELFFPLKLKFRHWEKARAVAAL